MDLFLRRAFRLPQTYLLLIGIFLGYLSLTIFFNFRAIALLWGGAIAISTSALWFWLLYRDLQKSSDNLLERDIFIKQLPKDNLKLNKHARHQYQEAKKWAIASQDFAAQIGHYESILIPELLETLNTVIALLQQVGDTLQAKEKMTSASGRERVEQRLQSSCDRLLNTKDSLQNLQESIAIASLDKNAAVISEDLPSQLSLLIDNNKQTLSQLKN
jgi:hypothetical protein